MIAGPRRRGIFWVVEPLFARAFRSQTRTELQKLKDVLESGSLR